jgi:hypothetical protein
MPPKHTAAGTSFAKLDDRRAQRCGELDAAAGGNVAQARDGA